MIPFKVKKHNRAKYALYYLVINQRLSYEHAVAVISQAYLCFNKAKRTFQKWDFGYIIQRHFLNRRTNCWSYLSEYLLKETK